MIRHHVRSIAVFVGLAVDIPLVFVRGIGWNDARRPAERQVHAQLGPDPTFVSPDAK